MKRRKTLGVNIARHNQIRSQKGGVLPMGAPAPATRLLPMAQPRRGVIAWVLGR